MSEFNAIPFSHLESLLDFVRQYGRPQAQGRYELHEGVRVRRSGEDEQSTFFLVRQDRDLPDNPSYRATTIAIEAHDDGERVRVRRGAFRGVYRIVSSRSADRLPALLGPVPAPPPEHLGAVLFWIEARETFQHLVTLSMRLGCDRLQAAAIGSGDVSGEEVAGRVLLLRAERPSYYVIDKALSEPGVEVFLTLGAGRLYVPWGTTHPLADLWYHDGDEALFMRGLSTRATMSLVRLPQWGDIYGLTRFTLDGLEIDEEWGEGALPIRRFSIQMQLVPAHRRREVHLWMLPATEQERLERLMHMIPESDLDALMFAAQESPDGERYLLIRERHTGAGRQYIDFEGLEFGPYAGYPNLMLPVDQDLEPPLRKDRYRDIFSLVTGQLTLLWKRDGKLRIVRVKEKSFLPMTDLVDYVIGAGSTELESMIERTVFDFHRFETAPRRPMEVAAPSKPSRSRSRSRDEEEDTYQATDAKPIEAPAPGDTEALRYPEQSAAEEKPKALDELARREIELEEQIIVQGQSTALWTELARLKEQLNKPGEAALCWQEAMWLSFEGDEEEAPLDEAVLRTLERRPDIAISRLSLEQRIARARQQATLSDSSPAWIWLHVAYGAGRALSKEKGEVREWLTEGYKLLTDRATSLRAKDRWVLWGKMLRLNEDSTQEAKVREALLDELTHRGLQSFEAPSFIRNRVYQSRFIQEQSSEDVDELEAANIILGMIQRELEQSNDLALGRVSSAILAYAWERLGNRGQSEHFSQQAESFLESPVGLTPIEQAWMTLYLSATADLRLAGSGRPWVDRYNTLLKMPSGQSLARSELEVIQESIFLRNKADNPTEFFSPDRFRTFFSQADGYGEAKAIQDNLDRHVQRGKFAAALSELKELANQAASGQLGLKQRPFSWLLGPIVKILRRIGQAAEGINILRKFEQSLDHLEERSRTQLFTNLFRLKLAEGYLDLGEEERGAVLITDVVQTCWKTRSLVWLDHLDMLGAALEAVEASPLHYRPEAVREVLNALFIIDKHPQDSEQYRPVKLRLLDHCIEVALSKEKLSLRRYKNYLDEDEFHVRFRIVNESLT